MINDLQKSLIQVYAKGKLDDVHASPEYQKLLSTHEGNDAFKAERLMVAEKRTYLDELLEGADTTQARIDQALRLLWKIRGNSESEEQGEREVFRELVLSSLGSTWAPNQRTYFETKSIILMQAKNYFLSFTSRNPNKPSQNLINANHKEFIKRAIGKARFESADQSGENLLALAIHNLLEDELLAGFFFPKHKGDNSIVEQKLTENCKQALSFVQLVHGEIFRHDKNLPTNWCFFEYSVVKDAQIPVLFVQVEDQISDANISLKFGAWYKEFAARDKIKLTNSFFYKEKIIQENVDNVEKLGQEITRYLNRIYESVPN